MMNEPKRFSLVKPTIDTPFHIDFEWWKQYDNNWRVFLHTCLCNEHQLLFSDSSNVTFIDWVDPVTAEVKPVDGIELTLISHCSQQPDFVSSNTTLVDAVFRILIANGNRPMSPNEMAVMVHKPADIILKTLTGPRVYRGVRPCNAC